MAVTFENAAYGIILTASHNPKRMERLGNYQMQMENL